MSRSHHRPSRFRGSRLTIGLLGLSLFSLASAGCYRHVVGTKNAPGYTGPVYEPNVEEGNENLFKTTTIKSKGSYYVD